MRALPPISEPQRLSRDGTIATSSLPAAKRSFESPTLMLQPGPRNASRTRTLLTNVPFAELEARLDSAAPAERIALESELGRRWARQGVPEQAVRWLASARTHAEAAGDRRTLAEIDLELGAVCAMRGEHDRALTLLDRAL